MNTKTNLATLGLCLALSTAAFANDEHHPETAAAAAAPATATPGPKRAADSKAMEANAAKLQAEVKRIAKARPGPERDKLVTEHMRTLRESMAMAKGMISSMDMENCPMREGMMGGKGMGGMGMGMGKPAGDPAERLERMERRMDMMEQMMKGGMTSKP